jgi:hypothetical protein
MASKGVVSNAPKDIQVTVDTTSTSIPDLMSAAGADYPMWANRITAKHDGTIRMANGTASGTSSKLLNSEILHLNKTAAESIELYASAGTTVTLWFWEEI